jgi:hypothetical protein
VSNLFGNRLHKSARTHGFLEAIRWGVKRALSSPGAHGWKVNQQLPNEFLRSDPATLSSCPTSSSGPTPQPCHLPGGAASWDPNSSFVDLPNNLLTNLTAITVETWATDNGNWSRVWDFGNSNGGEDISDTGSRYMFLTMQSGGGNLMANIHVDDRGGDHTIEWPLAGVLLLGSRFIWFGRQMLLGVLVGCM